MTISIKCPEQSLTLCGCQSGGSYCYLETSPILYTHTAGKDQRQNVSPGLHVSIPVICGGHSALWRCWLSGVSRSSWTKGERPTTTKSSRLQWAAGFSADSVQLWACHCAPSTAQGAMSDQTGSTPSTSGTSSQHSAPHSDHGEGESKTLRILLVSRC